MTVSNVRACHQNYLHIAEEKLEGSDGGLQVAHHKEANTFNNYRYLWEIEGAENGTVRIKSASSDPNLTGCYIYKSQVISGQTTDGGKATTYYIGAHRNAHLNHPEESLFNIVPASDATGKEVVLLELEASGKIDSHKFDISPSVRSRSRSNSPAGSPANSNIEKKTGLNPQKAIAVGASDLGIVAPTGPVSLSGNQLGGTKPKIMYPPDSAEERKAENATRKN